MPLAPGNCIFPFSARNIFKCHGLKVVHVKAHVGVPVNEAANTSAQTCNAPGPRKPVFRDFLAVGFCSAKTQNIKMLRNLGEKLLGQSDFPPKSAPSSGKLRFFRSWPGISLSAKGCPRPKGPRKPVFCDFLAVGFRSAKTQNVKKLHNFREKLYGAGGFPPKSTPSSGKLLFPVFGPEFL